MKNQIQAFLVALQFLTRLRFSCQANIDVNFNHCVVYFPLVGFLLGLILALGWQGLGLVVLAPVRAALLLALAVYLSGGLHLDGFIDSMDGLLSGREREQKLAIMKDSYVGAHGVTATIVLLLIKYSLLLSLTDGKVYIVDLSLQPLILLMPVLGRWAMLPAVTCYPYARKQGLGRLFGAGQGFRALVVATVITALICWLVMGPSGLLLLLLTGLLVVAWSNWVKRLLGGLTGDTYGALAEISEVFVLTVGLLLP
ncbi:MAG: adenosylcobinamide-GDP ribazoletransferase [Clostridia bacterium]|nr:adenosylcobinamide-GDP ribazoletransferase [Clostridia bacterium]